MKLQKYIKKNQVIKSVLITFGFLTISRLIPHPPNFTPIISVAILGVIIFKSLLLSVFIYLSSMVVSDYLIGLHSNMIFIYTILILISYISYSFKEKLNLKTLILFCLGGSIIFFLISNFVVWQTSGIYEKNIEGLIVCYIAALPFFTNTLISTIFYSYLSYLVINFKKFSYKII